MNSKKMAVILRDFSPEGPCAHRTGCGQTAYPFRTDVSRAQHDAGCCLKVSHYQDLLHRALRHQINYTEFLWPSESVKRELGCQSCQCPAGLLFSPSGNVWET